MFESPFNQTSREDFASDVDDKGDESHQEDEKDFDNTVNSSQKTQAMVRKPYLFYPDEKVKIAWDLFITL